MECGHCCGAKDIFNLKRARKQMKKYQKKGPDSSTRKLLQHIGQNHLSNRTLLDIGGGIGAIQWFFLENGARKTLDIDASGSYLKIASEYSAGKGWDDRSEFIMGDFVNQTQSFERYDFVTLDKVVCCYPDYQSLLTQASGLCRDTLALTFPVRNLISRFFTFLSGIYYGFKSIPFRTYVHSPSGISQLIQSCGFKRVYDGISYPWHVQIYQRKDLH